MFLSEVWPIFFTVNYSTAPYFTYAARNSYANFMILTVVMWKQYETNQWGVAFRYKAGNRFRISNGNSSFLWVDWSIQSISNLKFSWIPFNGLNPDLTLDFAVFSLNVPLDQILRCPIPIPVLDSVEFWAGSGIFHRIGFPVSNPNSQKFLIEFDFRLRIGES